MAEDSADIFDTALCALFAVPPIGFSTASPDEPHVYTPPCGRPVRLWLPHPPAGVHAALQANNLWLSAVFLADRVASTLSSTVVELGAGAGLPSIMAARAGARVTCTDYDDPVVVGTIRRNFEADGPGDWAVRGHSWGTDVSALLARAPGGYDAVLLADTLWSSDKHGILLDSVCSLLRRPRDDEGGVVHVAAGLHTGRGPVARFIEMAEQRGLRATLETEVQWQPGGGWDAHEWAGEGLQEERGVVVYHTLRWA
jgi:pimeloyl-ACP methyl ester carboxylesterase